MELLNSWGTTNSTVGELVDILKSKMLLAPASLLLPEPVVPVVLQRPTCHVTEDTNPFTTPSRPTPVVENQKCLPLPVCPPEPIETDSTATDYLSFSYHELMSITGNFDNRPTSEGGNRLGEGGFGTVYKGYIDHEPVAVKKLSPEEDILLEELQLQFHQEIQTLKTLKHQNLVDMVGYSCDGLYPCLVYVFMANGSVLDRLACMDDSPPLTWSRRCLIATGSARGLDYLHDNHHVHRDIKRQFRHVTGNILLDENFAAKISDFGLTRASPTHSLTTMQTERVVGTRAYMAPEALRGQITPKSDVFSFGVVLLEILSGLPPVDESRESPCLMELRHDIDDKDEDLTLEDFLDKKMSDTDMDQAERTYAVACNCLHERKGKRPTAKQVLSDLKEISRNFSAGALRCWNLSYDDPPPPCCQ
ncbi:hypothetical protein CRUP_015279, partial [Coryphaenoides rupestris]